MNNCYEVKTSTQKNIARRVLVIGGSLAGLFAARRRVFIVPSYTMGYYIAYSEK